MPPEEPMVAVAVETVLRKKQEEHDDHVQDVYIAEFTVAPAQSELLNNSVAHDEVGRQGHEAASHKEYLTVTEISHNEASDLPPVVAPEKSTLDRPRLTVNDSRQEMQASPKAVIDRPEAPAPMLQAAKGITPESAPAAAHEIFLPQTIELELDEAGPSSAENAAIESAEEPVDAGESVFEPAFQPGADESLREHEMTTLASVLPDQPAPETVTPSTDEAEDIAAIPALRHRMEEAYEMLPDTKKEEAGQIITSIVKQLAEAEDMLEAKYVQTQHENNPETTDSPHVELNLLEPERIEELIEAYAELFQLLEIDASEAQIKEIIILKLEETILTAESEAIIADPADEGTHEQKHANGVPFISTADWNFIRLAGHTVLGKFALKMTI